MVLPVPDEVVAESDDAQPALSVVYPVVSLDPPKGTFREPATVSIPCSSEDEHEPPPSLRLIAGTTETSDGPTCWRDVTNDVPVKLSDDEASFQPDVAPIRYMLIARPADSAHLKPAEEVASDVFSEAVKAPFVAKFVVFGKRTSPTEGRLKIFCLTDDVDTPDSFSGTEDFEEVARSGDVEVVDGKPQYVAVTGNLIPVTDPNVSTMSVPFHPFQVNQLPMDVRMWDITDRPTGVLAFTKYPKSAVEKKAPTPVCLLRATLPEAMVATLRRTRQQGAAGDVEYMPPDSGKPKKLELPIGDDEPPETALPVRVAYAAKEMPKEGPIECRKEVTEEQQVLDDGSVIKRQTAVTTSYTVTEPTSGPERCKEPKTREKIIRVDVEENSVCLPPGVIEPYGSNVVAKVATNKYEEFLPDGVPLSKNITVLSVKLKPTSDEMPPGDFESEREKPPLSGEQQQQQQQQRSPKSALERMEDLLRSDEEDVPVPSDMADMILSPVTVAEGGAGKPKLSKKFGPVSCKSAVTENEETLNDGTTVKWKTTTKRHVAAVTEVTELDGRISERPAGEKLVKTDIQEIVTKLAPGILYPYGSNVESETTETNFEDTLPDGSKVYKNVVNIDVRSVPLDSKDKDNEETAFADVPTPTKAMQADRPKYSPDRPLENKPDEYSLAPIMPDDKKQPDHKLHKVYLPDDKQVPRITTKEYRRGLSNGDVLIRKMTTKEYLDPTTPVSVSANVDDIGAHKMSPPEKVLGAEIEETVLRLPTGVIEAGGKNVHCGIDVAKSDFQTPSRVPVSKKTVTAHVNFKTQPTRVVKGDTQTRLKTQEDRHNLDDGTLVAEKTTDTDYFKPVVEVRCVDGKEVRLPLREEPVKMESLRNVLELHPGVIEPYGSNVTTNVSVESFDEKLPNGVPVKRKVVKLVVMPDKPDAGASGDDSKVKSPSAELEKVGIPATVAKSGDIAGKAPEMDAEKSFPSAAGSVTPSVHKKTIEKPIESRTAVTEDERQLPDGGTLRHKAVTVTRVRPCEEITIVNGCPTGSIVREEILDKEVDENFIKLPSGVKSAYGPDVDSESTVDHLDDEVVDGVVVKRIVRRTTVRRKPVSTTPALRDLLHEIENTVADTETAAVNKINELLSPVDGRSQQPRKAPGDDGSTVDRVPREKVDEVLSRTSVIEFQRSLDNGTTIRRIVAVTQHYLPAGPGRLEQLVDVEIDENLLALPPGVAEPNGDNCDTTIAVQKSERTLADGTPVRKTAATTVVTLKPPKTRLVEGDVEPRTSVEHDQKCLPDGSTIRRKIITTRKIRPVSEVTLADGQETVKFLREKIVGATIEENILELPPGVIEPSGANCDTDITVSQVDDALTDGTPAKRKIVRMVVRIKDHTLEKRPAGDELASEPQRTDVVDGPVRSETETTQYEENLEDGTTIVHKVIKTKHIRSVIERRSPAPGVHGEPISQDKLVAVDVEENILQLPPGVIEPFGKNCDNDISVDHSDQTLPDGVVVRQKVVKMTVRLKQPDVVKPPPTTKTVEGDAVERVDVKESERTLDNGTKSRTKRVTKKRVRPVTDVTVVDGVPTVTNYREVTLDASVDETVQELGPGVSEPVETDAVKANTHVEHTHESLPDGIRASKTVTTTTFCRKEPSVTQKFIEDPVEARTDVTEDSERQDDGTVIKWRIETTTFVKPVRVITRTNGVVTDTKVQEEVVKTEVDEHVTEMLPGVVEPFGDDVQTSSTEQYYQDTLPNGSPLKKKVVKVTASLRPSDNPRANEKPRKDRRIGLEGEMMEEQRSPGSSRRSSDSDDDGAYVSPTDGPSSAASETELCDYGVYADVVETEPHVQRDVQEFEETLPDSTVVRKRIVTTVEKKTVVMRALLPDDETGGAEPVIQRYVDVTEEQPQVITDVHDGAETMPDGEVSKKRIKTTGQQRLTTQRKLITGHLDDKQFMEHLQGPEQNLQVKRQSDVTSPADQSSRSLKLVLRKHIHKKTIIHGGKEETLVTETTRVEQDSDPPADLGPSIDAVIHQFMSIDKFGPTGESDTGGGRGKDDGPAGSSTQT